MHGKITTATLLVLCLFVTLTSAAPVSSVTSQQTVSVWSEVRIESGGAYSGFGYSSDLEELPAVRDCLRPFPIDCFSLQQNFWISDHSGVPVLWAKNAVYLASLGGVYHATYSFQVYGRDNRVSPILCEPESSSTSTCRSPFYVDYSPFPQGFEFYAHITGGPFNSTLQMVNDFGAVNWNLPPTISCPCFIETASNESQPWGTWPFELVAVGIDSTALATFRNNTEGTIGPTLVQVVDGSWHQTALGVSGCIEFQDCLRALSTQENSEGLRWDIERNLIYWSKDAQDQGVHITRILPVQTAPPALPTPRVEDYLYFEFSSTLAYMTVYDGSRRVAGLNPQTGRMEATMPNSSLVLDSYIPVKDTPANVPEEEVLIVNPQGKYQVVVSAGGNTAYSVFMSKVTNTNEILATTGFGGTLLTGDSKTLDVDSNNLALTGNSAFDLPFGLLSMVAVIIALISFVSIILVLLNRRRKRLLTLRPDYDEFR